MPVVWRRQMSLDNTMVDNDHKYLIYLINSFERSIDVFDNAANLLAGLKQLDEYARVHFHREEQLQARLGFPGHDHHHRCHLKMRDELKTLMARLSSSEPMDRELMNPTWFAEFLRKWLIEHIIKEDLLLKPYLKNE